MQATAWILDVSHRAKRVACDVPSGVRPLLAIRDAIHRELGLALDGPIGVRSLDAAPELLFLVPRAAEGPGWRPLREWAPKDEGGYRLYVEAMLGGFEPPVRELEVSRFGDTPELAAKLVHLVVKGVKRGTTAWLAASERDGTALPEIGTVSIITDGFGHAQCAIRTEQLERLRFSELDAKHAWDEGEGDRTLEDYRDAHLRYFQREARELGLTFTEDAPVLFERFRVLAVFGRADG